MFAEPLFEDALGLIRQNRACFESRNPNVQGRTLQQLRQWSREQVVAAARDYTSNLIGATLSDEPFKVILAGGHQPSLFHPGVWVKNFGIGELAARVGGVALNLVIDNDTISTSRLRVPGGSRSRPRYETIPFDADRLTGPWEEAHILDRELFQSFGEGIVGQMLRWNVDPLAADIWPDAVQQMQQSTLLRDCLTAARHRLERRWGLENLELPISRMCELDPFLWFTSHILAHLPRFRNIYNEVLLEYRRVNGIRSRTHPVADLKEADGWLESPFWVWRVGERQRGRVFAKQVGREVHLSNGTDVFATVPLTVEMDACCAVEVLRKLPAQGIRLRTRALTTTLFARLCFCDLFVHGTGGSKYDEMTDRIIARFFKLPAPAFLTLSATLRLAIAGDDDVTKCDELRLLSLLRDLQYNSDRHLTEGARVKANALIAEKSKLIAEQHAALTSHLSRSERRRPTRENHTRFRRFQTINRQLARLTLDRRRRMEDEIARVRNQITANSILQDREFSFCLYPAEKLRRLMAGLREHHE